MLDKDLIEKISTPEDDDNPSIWEINTGLLPFQGIQLWWTLKDNLNSQQKPSSNKLD